MRLGGEVDDRGAAGSRARDRARDRRCRRRRARARSLRGSPGCRRRSACRARRPRRRRPTRRLTKCEPMKPAPPVTSTRIGNRVPPVRRFGAPARRPAPSASGARRSSGPAATAARRHSASPSRQCGSSGAPFSLRSTSTAGRGALRPELAGRDPAHAAPRPASSKIASAKSAQVQSPAAARCQMPNGQLPTSSRRRRARGGPTYVGQPRWSSTTATSSRSAPSRSIVRTKLWPVGPKSHELRTIHARSPAAASRVELRAPVGREGIRRPSDSTYGAPLRPSKT